MSEPEQAAEIADRMNVLKNIAARAWPSGSAIGFCWACGKEKEYNWDQLAKMMAVGFPRCKCNNQRIDLKYK